ncbi:MAG: metalloregulator ArsR/SmtB family transcription factor [Planctomycetota bacterium]
MLSLEDSTDLCRLLSDSTRTRLLAILAEEELTVAELTEVTRLTQSRVSTHLGKLREAKLVRDRRDGTSCFYSLNTAMPEATRQLWELLRDSTADPLIEEDLGRVSDVVRARERGAWADAVAGRMHRHYSPGRTWEAATRAILGFVELGHVLDVASGDGVLAELVATSAQSVTCVDVSDRVVDAARRRLSHLANVNVIVGDMHALPFEDHRFDQVALMNALTYAAEPAKVIEEAARVLRPGGAIIGSTLKSHKHHDSVAQYDHVQHGFEPEEVHTMLEAAGFTVTCCDITCRERRAPYFEIITIHARSRGGA